MSGFDEVLRDLLSDPESMGKIMELARSFNSEGSEKTAEKEEKGAELEDSNFNITQLLGKVFGDHTDQENLSDISDLSFDPKLVSMALQVMDAWKETDKSEAVEVLQAMRSKSSHRKMEKIDRALRAVRLAHLAHEALEGFGGKKE